MIQKNQPFKTDLHEKREEIKTENKELEMPELEPEPNPRESAQMDKIFLSSESDDIDATDHSILNTDQPQQCDLSDKYAEQLNEIYKEVNQEEMKSYLEKLSKNRKAQCLLLNPDFLIRYCYLKNVYENEALVCRMVNDLTKLKNELLEDGYESDLELLLIDQIVNSKASAIRDEMELATLPGDSAVFPIVNDRLNKSVNRMIKSIKTLMDVRKQLSQKPPNSFGLFQR